MIWISILRQYGNQFHPLWNLPGVYAAQHMQQETSWILWVSSRVLRCTHISRIYLNLLNPVSHTRWRPSKESTVVAFRARPWWWHVGIWVSSWSWSVCPSHKSCSSGQKGMGLWREELNTQQWKLTWLPQDEFQQIYQIYFFANICQGLLWSQMFTLILWYSLFLFSTNLITGQESKGCRPFCFLALTWVVSFSNKLYSCIWWLYNGSIDLQKIFHHFWFVSERVVTPFWFFGWNTPGHRCCCHLDHFGRVTLFLPMQMVQTRWSTLPRWWKAWLSCSSANCTAHKIETAKTKNHWLEASQCIDFRYLRGPQVPTLQDHSWVIQIFELELPWCSSLI